MNLKPVIGLVVLLALSLAGKSATRTSSKPVHVREYTRKDGTVVQAHDRATSRSTPRATPAPKVTHVSPATSGVKRTANGRIARSETAKRSFEASHPCPATGRSGACPGYIIDHVRPLACGGADAPENMSWQTKSEAAAKDKWERAGCR